MSEKLEWHNEVRKVQDLLPYEKNPRKISEKQMASLKKSLKQFGLAEIPCIDADNKIIAGHQRIKALLLLGQGEETIDVRIPNRKLTQEEYERYLITSNAVTGDWDFDLLKGFDLDLLTDIGFDSDDLSKIWDDTVSVKDEDFDVEKELKKITDPKTKLGDVYELGSHRLICGDSTDPKVLERLFGDKRASMIYSDPVYNIDLDYNKGLGGKQQYGGAVIDKRTDDEYREFLKKSMLAALTVTNKDAHVFYWNTEQHIWIIQTLYRELGISNKRVCLWIKNGFNPTPKVAFNKCYEPCIYGTIGSPYLSGKEQGLTEVMNKDVGTGNDSLDDINIWTAKRVSSKEYSHATTKPIDLHEKPIQRCTKLGDIILDSFGGSGSTLIAAEQLKRKAYLVELESIFCDLIIKRWEKLTSLKAKLINEER